MTREGLLWFDDDPNRNLAEKVAIAARRYERKFGHKPVACYVHPSALGDVASAPNKDGVLVLPLASVLRHHFWMVEEV